MSACRNPECKNGYTPGVLASGKGSPRAPVVGATMRWGWVNCRACSPKDKDPPYAHVSRSGAEIQERARLADSKAPYEHQAPAKRPALEKIAAGASGAIQTPPSSNGISSERLDKLLEQVSKLTDQVTALLDENRSLRASLEAATKKGGKKRGSTGSENPRALS